MKAKIKPEIEVFDQMAPGWYGFRHHSIFEAELQRLAKTWKKGRLLNIGCGHGPDFVAFRDTFELTGLDFSSEMIKLARRYSHKFEFPVNLQIGDARYLPFANKSFDFAIAVATYHHLKGRDDQLAALLGTKTSAQTGRRGLCDGLEPLPTAFLVQRSRSGHALESPRTGHPAILSLVYLLGF